MVPLSRRLFVTISVVGGIGVQRVLLAHSPRPMTVHGRIIVTVGRAIYATSTKGPLTVYVEDKSNIWKGKDGVGVDVLKPGDLFSAVVKPDASGKLVVDRMWVNIVNYYGPITRINGNEFELVPERPKGLAAVRAKADADTIINNGKGSPSELRLGRFVQMVGELLPNGTVRATRMWIYENGSLTSQ